MTAPRPTSTDLEEAAYFIAAMDHVRGDWLVGDYASRAGGGAKYEHAKVMAGYAAAKRVVEYAAERIKGAA